MGKKIDNLTRLIQKQNVVTSKNVFKKNRTTPISARSLEPISSKSFSFLEQRIDSEFFHPNLSCHQPATEHSELPTMFWHNEEPSLANIAAHPYEKIAQEFDSMQHEHLNSFDSFDPSYFSISDADQKALEQEILGKNFASVKKETLNFPQICEKFLSGSIVSILEKTATTNANFLEVKALGSHFSFSPKVCEKIIHGVLEEVHRGSRSVIHGSEALAQSIAPVVITKPLAMIAEGSLELSHQALKYACSTGIYGGHFFVVKALPWAIGQAQGLAEKGGLNKEFIQKFQDRSEKAFAALPVLQRFYQKGEDARQYAESAKNLAMNLIGDLTGRTAALFGPIGKGVRKT